MIVAISTNSLAPGKMRNRWPSTEYPTLGSHMAEWFLWHISRNSPSGIASVVRCRDSGSERSRWAGIMNQPFLVLRMRLVSLPLRSGANHLRLTLGSAISPEQPLSSPWVAPEYLEPAKPPKHLVMRFYPPVS